ncbi:PREDICTED: interleukin-1 receptor accessory protein-like 1-B [Polistes canadensis]|uniref:interleukin-1 receptor accessory protein-like 1-B n=1 Tax=Polistes canadensis TaxID=91411 RepID=UPI000718D8EA|nr:PREDICTED: interleukin-1 receptor accessory protein-like 1-B [Polistes canadensis]
MAKEFHMKVFIFAFLLPVLCGGNELKEYCSSHRFDNLHGGLRFTKEVISTEYTNVGRFKSLHCCLRGYRSIEWFKDNRAYPWPGGESYFILYPESANQTIYTQDVRPSDAGRYSCQARNDTTILEGDITLTVLGEEPVGYLGKPLPTYKPASQLVPLGGAARLFCEAYVGRIRLPDAKNSVIWSKTNSNVTLPTHGRIAQYPVSRENNQIIGSYLEIKDMTVEDYGEYVCEISNGLDEVMAFPAHIYRKEPQFTFELPSNLWRKPLLITVLSLVLLLSAVAFYARCWLPLLLYLRDKFARLEKDDGKECDAIVCYHEKDSSLAIGIIVPTLESRHRYKCTTLELTCITKNWILEIGPHVNTARRIIVVLSPGSLGDIWTESSVLPILKQLAGLSTRTIAVILKELPNTTTMGKPSSRRGDRSDSDFVLFDRLKILRWEEPNNNPPIDKSLNPLSSTSSFSFSSTNFLTSGNRRKFWYKLRLAMPPIRPIGNESTCQSVAMIVQSNGKCGQQKARSRESLEVLV